MTEDLSATEKQRAYSRKYYWKDHERTLELARIRAAKARENNREEYNRKQREYNAKHKDRINELRRNKLKNDAEHAEKVRERDRLRYAENPEGHRNTMLASKYGISLAEYQKMYDAQNGKCKICSDEKPPQGKSGLVVDHCHDTGRVRGLLCKDCNTAIGHLRDSIENLQSAIKYLKG